MATVPVSLFYLNKRTYQVGSLSFDLILSESHSHSNILTEHNVEDGSVITDHVHNNLINGSLTGLISNFSLKVFGLSSNRAQDGYDELQRIWKSREIITISTVMRVYRDVIISDFNINRSEGTGEAMVVDISFKQIKIVKLKEVAIDASIKPLDNKTAINKQIKPSVDVGRTTQVVR